MASAAGAGGGGGGKPGERNSRGIRLTVQEAAKKLSLWHTPTFRPIITHDDLEHILADAGFVALPLPPDPSPPTPQDHNQQAQAQVRWREYAFLGCGAGRNAVVGWTGPRPRLPYPRVDALHIRTYQVYLGAARVPDLFHVRLGLKFWDVTSEVATRPVTPAGPTATTALLCRGCERQFRDDDGQAWWFVGDFWLYPS